MKDYKIVNDTTVLRTKDHTFVPLVPGNADFTMYEEWLAEGNTPDPADPVSNVPAAVTMRQARLALLQTGKLDTVNAAIAAMPGDAGAAARIEWEFSSSVERNREYVKQIATGLGMTDKQLDDLFILAATL